MYSGKSMLKPQVSDIQAKKGRKKITMLTCYDYSFAKALDGCGLDMILVGDSMANVVLGLKETRQVSFSEMLNHTKAVKSAVEQTLVIADMPYSACRDTGKCLRCAQNFIKIGADAVKIEWFDGCDKLIKKIIKNKIPVMSHIGLTPQTAHRLGGFKVQGKDVESASKIYKQARILEEAGVFSIVLECIPYQLAGFITKNISIPTIGIGAGKFCDGQVIVLYDLIGLYNRIVPRFVRRYQNMFFEVQNTAMRFIGDVRSGRFPEEKESFSMSGKEWKVLSRKMLGKRS